MKRIANPPGTNQSEVYKAVQADASINIVDKFCLENGLIMFVVHHKKADQEFLEFYQQLHHNV
ncbi:hypothetical protein Q0590_24870 [Rhodocytophaga aerolata]|uniref:Uncharacterized protein n=1 Tax=Rhodocytophaga aerolata TaxID=455078 RepID=A0ABT8REB7_9BACT|nr:hypothetical protein [Rhodocytophaga aerolata]MDO1449533.1 hypothetical protein [Rhodocytophaga aerolata]